MRKRKTQKHKSTGDNFTEQTTQNGFLVMRSHANSSAKTRRFGAEQQVHTREHKHATAQRKTGEIAYITITPIITLGNPIKINSSMEGVPNTHTHRNRGKTHQPHMANVLNARANQLQHTNQFLLKHTHRHTRRRTPGPSRPEL